MDRSYDVAHSLQLRLGETRSGGEADAAGEEILGDGAAHHREAPEHGLQVHRLPHGPALDVLLLEREAHVFSRRAEL